MKAFWIKSAEQLIEEVEFHKLNYLQTMVGGYIEYVTTLPNGDVLYVNEYGKVTGTLASFQLPGIHDILAGDGVLVGREKGSSGKTHDPKTTLIELGGLVMWGGPYEGEG